MSRNQSSYRSGYSEICQGISDRIQVAIQKYVQGISDHIQVASDRIQAAIQKYVKESVIV